jgi:hypothetical protein
MEQLKAFSEQVFPGGEVIVGAELIGENLRLTFSDGRTHMFKGKNSWIRKGNFQSGLLTHLQVLAQVPENGWQELIMEGVIRSSTLTGEPVEYFDGNIDTMPAPEDAPLEVLTVKDAALDAFSKKLALFEGNAVADAELIGDDLRLTLADGRQHLFKGKDSWFRKDNFQLGLMHHLKVYAEVPEKKWKEILLRYIIGFAPQTSMKDAMGLNGELSEYLNGMDEESHGHETKARVVEMLMSTRDVWLSHGAGYGKRLSIGLTGSAYEDESMCGPLFSFQGNYYISVELLHLLWRKENESVGITQLSTALVGLGWTREVWNGKRRNGLSSVQKTLFRAPQSFVREDVTND